MSEHTPGPWLDWDTLEWRYEPRRLLESTANARLIAAAPDLLAALELAVSLKGGWREAIAELEDFCSEPVRLKNMLAAIDQLDDFVKQARAAIAKAKG